MVVALPVRGYTSSLAAVVVFHQATSLSAPHREEEGKRERENGRSNMFHRIFVNCRMAGYSAPIRLRARALDK